jgi:vacuolar-type H+-ATPase subunit H
MGTSERSVEKTVVSNGAPEASEALGRAVANIIRAAEQSADALTQEARVEANEALERAIEKAERIGREAADKAVSLLDEAVGRAEKLTSETERHTRDLREAARRQCERMLQTVLQRQHWLTAQENELSTRLQQAQETLVKLRSLLVSDQVGDRLKLDAPEKRRPETLHRRDQVTSAVAANVTKGEGAAEGSPRIAAE